jgi:hypothetical protein
MLDFTPLVAELNLSEVIVRPVDRFEEPRFQHLMQQHHYLGALPKISESLWYVASWADQWVKQPGLFQDIALFFNDRQSPDFVLTDSPDHGRIETRKIWTTTELNGYLNFPHIAQAFCDPARVYGQRTPGIHLSAHD